MGQLADVAGMLDEGAQAALHALGLEVKALAHSATVSYPMVLWKARTAPS